MHDLERECIVWCPKCRKDKFEVQRQPTSQNGVYQNVILDISSDKAMRWICEDCNGVLERKPA